jgi:hypothetical protein
MTWHIVINKVLEPIKDVNLNGSGYFLDCPYSKVCQFYPIIAAWIADNMEYIVVAHLISGFCPICEIPKNAMSHESGTLRTDPLGINSYPRHNKLKYQCALVSGG